LFLKSKMELVFFTIKIIHTKFYSDKILCIIHKSQNSVPLLQNYRIVEVRTIFEFQTLFNQIWLKSLSNFLESEDEVESC
jgi:ABC-type microcin C transport system permease subunit YejE